MDGILLLTAVILLLVGALWFWRSAKSWCVRRAEEEDRKWLGSVQRSLLMRARYDFFCQAQRYGFPIPFLLAYPRIRGDVPGHQWYPVATIVYMEFMLHLPARTANRVRHYAFVSLFALGWAETELVPMDVRECLVFTASLVCLTVLFGDRWSVCGCTSVALGIKLFQSSPEPISASQTLQLGGLMLVCSAYSEKASIAHAQTESARRTEQERADALSRHLARHSDGYLEADDHLVVTAVSEGLVTRLERDPCGECVSTVISFPDPEHLPEAWKKREPEDGDLHLEATVKGERAVISHFCFKHKGDRLRFHIVSFTFATRSDFVGISLPPTPCIFGRRRGTCIQDEETSFTSGSRSSGDQLDRPSGLSPMSSLAGASDAKTFNRQVCQQLLQHAQGPWIAVDPPTGMSEFLLSFTITGEVYYSDQDSSSGTLKLLGSNVLMENGVLRTAPDGCLQRTGKSSGHMQLYQRPLPQLPCVRPADKTGEE